MALVATVLIALAAGCDESDDAPPSTRRPSAAISPSDSSPCANEAEVVADDSTRLAGELDGDVDGDGSPDLVVIHLDAAGDPGCRAFVVVETDGGRFAGPIWEIGSEGGLSEPALYSLAPINTSPGSEIVVREAQGASTSFVGAYALVDGRVARIEVSGGSVSAIWDDVTGLFPYGGSVGHLEAVDCEEAGIVVTLAEPGDEQGDLKRGIYSVTRETYEVAGASMELASTTTEDAPVEDLQARFPEFSTSPFGNC